MCKEWNKFLDKEIWHDVQGSRRITENWLWRSPLVTEIPILPFTSREVVDFKAYDWPMSIVIAGKDLICSVIGNIDVLDKKSGALKKRLCSSNCMVHWKLSVSKEFLLAHETSIGKVVLWDRDRDYAEIRLQGVNSMGNNLTIFCLLYTSPSPRD